MTPQIIKEEMQITGAHMIQGWTQPYKQLHRLSVNVKHALQLNRPGLKPL